VFFRNTRTQRRIREVSMTLFRLFGVPVIADMSTAFLLLLVGLNLSGVFAMFPLVLAIAFIVAAGLLLFFGLILHEFAHVLVARHFGIRTDAVHLWGFGAAAAIQHEPYRPSHQFLIGLAGPLTSFAVGIVYAVVGMLSESYLSDTMVALLALSAVWQVVLGIFNLIPFYPMDGGRVLHSILWKVKGNWWATSTSRALGKWGGIALAIYGFASMFILLPFGSFWLIFIGWMLYSVNSR